MSILLKFVVLALAISRAAGTGTEQVEPSESGLFYPCACTPTLCTCADVMGPMTAELSTPEAFPPIPMIATATFVEEPKEEAQAELPSSTETNSQDPLVESATFWSPASDYVSQFVDWVRTAIATYAARMCSTSDSNESSSNEVG